MTVPLVQSWQFKSDGVLGYIVGGGEHGVQIAATADRKPGTRPMCLNVEHYYSRSHRGGRFVPRNKAATHTDLIAADTVCVQIEPFGDWRVRTTVTFRSLAEAVIEATYEFSFEVDIAGFEAFISNYFHEPTEPFIHVGGEWQQPKLSDHEHRFWPRGLAEAENIKAIYPREAEPGNDVLLPVDPSCLDHPVMVTPIRDSAQSIINVVEPAYCASLSANRRWQAHDFSFGLGDVAKGQTATCRAWLCCRALDSLVEAILLSEEWR